MDTTFEENPKTGEIDHKAVWKSKRFQTLAAVAIGTGLVLSIVGVLCLKAPVDNLKNEKLPAIQSKVDNVQAE